MKNYKYILISFLIPVIIITGSGFAFFPKKKKAKSQQNQEQTQDNSIVKVDKLTFEYYNEFPGTKNINLYGIYETKEIRSIPVISPDKSKIAYTEVYLYPQNMQRSSKAFYVQANLKSYYETGMYNREIFKLDDPNNPPVFMLETNFNRVENQGFRTLTIVDWAKDSSKILFKEIIGEHLRGIWATNLWVYDFPYRSAYKLEALRKSVIYFWKNFNKLDIRDYRWDIVPLGWSSIYPNQIIVNVYGYDNDEKKFMGAWMVDYKGNRARLLSLVNEKLPIAKHGLVLIENKNWQ